MHRHSKTFQPLSILSNRGNPKKIVLGAKFALEQNSSFEVVVQTDRTLQSSASYDKYT